MDAQPFLSGFQSAAGAGSPKDLASHILTADAAFDGLPDIERLDPANVAIWRERAMTDK